MPEIKAKLNYLNIAPRKTRLIANLIKSMPLIQAKAQLIYLPQRAAKPLLKLLNSAAHNAKSTFSLDEDNLFVKSIKVDGGPVRKSYLPRAQGRATPILKRTSHVSIILEELKKPLTKKFKKVQVSAPQRPEPLKPIAEIKDKKEEKPVKETPKFKPIKEIKKPLTQRLKEGFKAKIFRRKSI